MTRLSCCTRRMRNNARSAFAARCAAALALMVGLSACAFSGGMPEASAPPDTSPTPPAETAQATPDDSSIAASAPSDSATGAMPSDAPVATRTATLDTVRYSLDVYPLARGAGELVTLSVKLSVVQAGPDMVSSYNLLASDDGLSAAKSRANGMRLIDAPHRLALLPAVDAETEAALCSPESVHGLRKGDSILITCVYGGAIRDATEFDVVLPTFGTVRHVAVR